MGGDGVGWWGSVCDTSCGDTGVFAHIAENAIFHLSAPQEGREEVTKAFASTADNVWCTLTGSESTLHLQTQQHYIATTIGITAAQVTIPQLSSVQG